MLHILQWIRVFDGVEDASLLTPPKRKRGIKSQSLTPNPSPGGEGLKEHIINDL
jgi:hypothetical protein